MAGPNDRPAKTFAPRVLTPEESIALREDKKAAIRGVRAARIALQAKKGEGQKG